MRGLLTGSWSVLRAPPRASVPMTRGEVAVFYSTGHTGLVWEKATQRHGEAKVTWHHLGWCPLRPSGQLAMADLERADY